MQCLYLIFIRYSKAFKVASKLWKELDENEKAKWKKQADDARIGYKQEKLQKEFEKKREKKRRQREKRRRLNKKSGKKVK